jgi:hypothetical protein
MMSVGTSTDLLEGAVENWYQNFKSASHYKHGSINASYSETTWWGNKIVPYISSASTNANLMLCLEILLLSAIS